MPHLSLDVATMVLDGELPARVLVQILYDHVKELCPKCRQALEAVQGTPAAAAARAGERPAAAAGPEQYLAAIDAAGRRVGERLSAAEEERRRARRDLATLRRLPPAERQRRIRAARSRFRSRALAELLVEASRQTARNDPAEAAALAGLVPIVLAHVTCPVDRAAAPSLVVLALAHRANALRVAGGLPAADRVFAEVRERLAAAPLDDPALHAEVCSLEASLRRDQRRPDDAERLIDRSILLARMGHDDRALAKALIQRADLLGERQELTGARASLREAMTLLGESGDRHLLGCAVGTLALIECERGAFTAAEQIMNRHRSLLAGDGGAWWMMRALTLEGRIALGLGRHEEAEDRLLRAYRLSVEEGTELDAVLGLLELAVLYVEQGRTAEVRRIAQQIQPAFASLDVQLEATAALMLFQQAAAAERVTVEAIRGLRDGLQRRLGVAAPDDQQPS
jgi:tetratricopeptide (TPR) repeat protein